MADGLLPGLLAILQQSGPAGAVVAGGIVGLVLTLILLAHFKGLWSDLKGRSQSTEFQDKLLALIANQQASEEALRRHLDELSRDKTSLQAERDDLRVQIVLLRSQRRRLIEMLRRHDAPSPVHGGTA